MKETPRLQFPCEMCGDKKPQKQLTLIPWKDQLLNVCKRCEIRTRRAIQRKLD